MLEKKEAKQKAACANVMAMRPFESIASAP